MTVPAYERTGIAGFRFGSGDEFDYEKDHPMRLKIYKSHGQWRWTLYARNGKKVANSGEAYKRRGACERIAYKLFPWAGQHAPSEPEGPK